MVGKILRQYIEARVNQRLDLFLQFPDLRRSFQEIDHKDFAYHKVSPSLREGHDKAKYSLQLCSKRKSRDQERILSAVVK